MKVFALALSLVMVATGFGVDSRHKSHGFLLVVNQGDKSMSVVDASTNGVVATIDEAQTTMHGHEVAASPDGRIAFMPIYGSSGVGSPGLDGSEMLVIDLPTRKIVAHVDFGHGVRPHCAVYEPARRLLYVTTELDQTVSIIDPNTFKIVGTVPTGQAQSHMLAISSDGRRGYVSNVGPGTVSVLDLDTRKVVTVIPISRATQRIAISRDDQWVFASDATSPRMAVIRTATNSVSKWIELPGLGYGSATTRDGKKLLVAIPSKDLVAVIDIASMQVERTIMVAKSPQELLVRPDGKYAYVSSSAAKKISVIDLKQYKTTSSIDVGNYPDGLAWAN